MPTDQTPVNASLWTVLQPPPNADPSGPRHVYVLEQGQYRVQALTPAQDLPDFWWRARGRLVDTFILDGTFEGLHVIITFFQFYAPRDEVFQTAHITESGWTILARAADADAARRHHQEAVAHLKTTTPRAAQEDALPSWL
ncbi:hypothetical protein [Deinococcus multiflagellatus]|uniref:Uncharacterized protein n=1 Tax=Deinococcus multiflagellatus TaxID=1656887 RepID=A0ABW1ZRT6_9DEIO|nr:hypothetical protein [Deinococcus multiflagellatus]MBZ9714396.1 hypothetical protein [Deinococcus multiflagellatus]